ncbi:hypothetical protein BAU67_001923 [Escherichia coli]|nr:hypothetical protein [Escherichia coli]
MKLEDIIVTPENYDQYNLSTQMVNLGCAEVSPWLLHSKELNECLDAHMSVNRFLDKNTHWKDAGGKYASWLESMGFDYQSDEGWWSFIAISPETLQCFVKYSNDDSFKSVVDSAINRYRKHTFNHDIDSVAGFIDVFA